MTTHRNKFSFVLILLLLSMLACNISGGGNNDTPSSPREDQSQVDEEPVALEVPGVATLELLTPTEGVGEKPFFEWEAVSGATRYSLVLFSSDGQPYWSWEGSETKVYLGGTQEQPEVDSQGPSLYEEMTWYVAAFDTEGDLIAVSQQVPIAP